jgi:hypothetical protein
MLGVRLRLRFESDEFFIDHVELKNSRLQVADRSISTLPIGHMEVDHNKFIRHCSEDVKYSPLFSVYLIQVNFSCNLINIVKFFYRKVFKSSVLASLTVKLQENMLVFKSVDLDNIFERIKNFCWSFLSDSSETNVVHFVEPLICSTRRLSGISAVILIVWITSFSCYLATKIIKAIDSDVYECFRLINKIFANYISTFASSTRIHVSISDKLAVGVLNIDRLTL